MYTVSSSVDEYFSWQWLFFFIGIGSMLLALLIATVLLFGYKKTNAITKKYSSTKNETM